MHLRWDLVQNTPTDEVLPDDLVILPETNQIKVRYITPQRWRYSSVSN